MAWVPIVLGIKPWYGSARCENIEIIYRSDDKIMRLERIHESEAKREIEKYGMFWSAYQWRYMDGLSDWEYVK